MTRISALMLLALLTACGGPAKEEKKTAAPSTPAAPPEHVEPAIAVARDQVATEQSMIPEIAGLPIAPGRWIVRQEEAGLAALYGQPETGAVLSFRCDQPAKQIIIRRSGLSGANITILTDRGINLFEADKPDEGLRATIARFPSNFPWFRDVLAQATGDFGVRVDGGEPLVVPADGALAQVVNNCPK